MDRLDHAVGLGREDRRQAVQSDIRRLNRSYIALPLAPDAGEEEGHTVGASEPAIDYRLGRVAVRSERALCREVNRHRGKGQQKVTVEHVHVHSGRQAIVGNVSRPGGGDQAKQEEQAHAKQMAMHRSRRCGARTRSGKPCQSPAMPNGRCRMHGGPSPGAPKGNRNAYKHGRYTAEVIERRRELAALLRAMRALSAES
jgi:hypothetical protein